MRSIATSQAKAAQHDLTLHHQGYELTEDEINISLDEFRSQYGDDTGGPARAKMAFTARPSEQMLKRYTPITRPGEEPREPEIGLIHVEFSPDPNVGIKQLKQFAQLLDEKKYFTGKSS
jgi:DNA-directed RNA polymerase I, II, and III subunit RPABC1